MTDREELVRTLNKIADDLLWARQQEAKGVMAFANSDDTMHEDCIRRLRESAQALSAQQPVGTVEDWTHAYGTKVKWARKMVAGEVLYTAPPPAQQPVASKVVCHAPGERCLGCDHYKGLLPECVYAAPVSAEAIELAKLMLLPRYTDQDGKKVAAALLRVAEGAQKQGPTEEEVKLAQRIADSRGEFADMMVASTAGLLLARAVLRLAHK